MIAHDSMETGIPGKTRSLKKDVRTVLFREEYLDKLVEAEALLEVAGKILSHHDDVQMTPKTFMGMSILLENITKIINIDAYMVNDSITVSEIRHHKKL